MFQDGNYHAIIPSGDMSQDSNYVTNNYLKSQVLDYYGNINNKYRVNIHR